MEKENETKISEAFKEIKEKVIEILDKTEK